MSANLDSTSSADAICVHLDQPISEQRLEPHSDQVIYLHGGITWPRSWRLQAMSIDSDGDIRTVQAEAVWKLRSSSIVPFLGG